MASRQLQFLSEEKVSMSSEIVQTKQIMQEERAQSAALRQHLQEAISQVTLHTTDSYHGVKLFLIFVYDV